MMNCSNLNKTGIDTGLWGFFVLAAEHNHDVSVILSITEYFHPHKNSSSPPPTMWPKLCSTLSNVPWKQNVSRQWLGPYLKAVYLMRDKGLCQTHESFFSFFGYSVACGVLVLWQWRNLGTLQWKSRATCPTSANVMSTLWVSKLTTLLQKSKLVF